MKTNNCYVLYRKEKLNPWAVMKSDVDIRIITATNEDLREAVKKVIFAKICITGSMNSLFIPFINRKK
jgi:hypothetical protein